jgi:protein TonB
MTSSVRTIALGLAAFAALSSSALAADAPAGAAPGCPDPNAKDQVAYIKNPKWQKMPGPDDVNKVFPPFALKGHKNDRVVMDCGIADDGSLKDCTVVEDKRPGLGFDKATLSLSKLYRMPPLAEQPAFTNMPECFRKLGAPHVVIPMDFFAGG